MWIFLKKIIKKKILRDRNFSVGIYDIRTFIDKRNFRFLPVLVQSQEKKCYYRHSVEPLKGLFDKLCWCSCVLVIMFDQEKVIWSWVLSSGRIMKKMEYSRYRHSLRRYFHHSNRITVWPRDRVPSPRDFLLFSLTDEETFLFS